MLMDVTSIFKPAGEDLRLLIVHSTEDELGQNIANGLTSNLNNGINITEKRVSTLGCLAQMDRPENGFHVVLLIAHGDKATNQAWLFGDVDINENDIGTNAAILKAGLNGLINESLCLFGICYFGQDLLEAAAIIGQGEGEALGYIAPNGNSTISNIDIQTGFAALLNELQTRKCDVSIDDLNRILDDKLSDDLRQKLVVVTAAT